MAPAAKPTDIGTQIKMAIGSASSRYTASVKVRDLIRTVEQDGWIQVRHKGSHRQYHHPSKAGTVTVAGHPSDFLHPKTLATSEIVPEPSSLAEMLEVA